MDRFLTELDSKLARLTEEFVAASRTSLDWFGRPIDVANKVDVGFDPVTLADRSVEDSLRTVINEHFPEHDVLGEEGGLVKGRLSAGSSSPLTCDWIIDPIDGTRAFITGRPMWGSLIGLRVDGVPVAGWMHLPVLDQTFVGFNGRTMLTANGVTTPISTSSTTSIDEAVLFSTHPAMFTGRDAEMFSRVESTAKLSRWDGDCANYGLLAAGFGDLVIENQLQPYDILPLIPIIEGAGGVITDLNGSAVTGGWAVAAANATLHERALELLNPQRSSRSSVSEK